ncbi:dynein regulatory complex subunit 2 [Strix uralensis]|uniref:dynein regulatory complex subunit 2 n=1 Tax=Strix uralensis TaxID=36305 RepID=UPI003DA76F87
MPDKRRPRAAAPMAAEDEVLLLQSQALAEEEAAKRKGEMLTRFLKDKLAKEERSSTLNLHELRTRWRAVLRDAKAKALHRDIEILSQTFARVMDCKDGVIESLVTDLEEAEEQHARALRSHLHNIDRLLQLQRCRLRCLEEGYGAQLQALRMEFEGERRTILEQHERESRYLRDVALAAERDHAENNHEATLNFQSARDDIKNKSLQEKQHSRLQLEGKAEVLWEQFQRAVQSYAEATKHQKVAFEVLKEKDKKSSREMEKQAKKLQKLQDSVTATKGRIAAHLRESEEQNRRGREEKEKALRRLQELKSEMNQARAKAHGSLARLTAQSNAALTALAQVVEKAQRILRLAELCRRLESEEEKVLPFYPSSLEEEEEQRDARRVLEEPPAEPLARALGDYVGLERFWQRFNKAKLEELALARQRAALSQRNRRLRELLRQYLGGISVFHAPPPSSLPATPRAAPPGTRPALGGGGHVHEVMRAPCTPTPTQTPSPAPPVPAEDPPLQTRPGDTAEMP